MANLEQNYHQQVAIGIVSGLFFLTTCVVYLRLYIRCIFLKAGSAGWDDLTVFIAWVMTMGASIAIYCEIASGLGRHIEELTPDQLHGFNLSMFVVIQFYMIGLSFVKLSFLAQYHRAFSSWTIRRSCMCFAFFCFMWMIVQAILYSFSCIPIQYLVSAMSAVCIPTLGIWTAISTVNVLTDAIIFAIPLKPLREMPLLRNQKNLLIGLYGLGFFICIISIIRIPMLFQGASSPDPTFTDLKTGLWSLAELELSVICTCLPVLRPILAHFIRDVSAPDTDDNQFREGSEHPQETKRRAKSLRDSQLNTTTSGSTMTTRSFFRSVASRDGDMEEEHPVRSAVTGTKVVGLTDGQVDDDKDLAKSKIAEGNYRKRDEEKALDAPIDFFHRPTLDKAMKKPPPILPRDLRKDTSLDSTWRIPAISAIPSSPHSSTKKLLHTPNSPTSTFNSANDTHGLSSARTTNSFFQARSTQGDYFYSQDVFNYNCKTSAEALKREVCSMCSSELLPERLRSPALPPPIEDQAHDVGTQTIPSRARKTSVVQRLGDAKVTHSTQTATPYESTPESSRPSSLHKSEDRVDASLPKQGNIARARERAMQAIAGKTYSQITEVYQGRARVVEVDSSQRRKAAIGLEEVLGLDVDRNPRRPDGPVKSRKEAMVAADDESKSPTAIASKEATTVEPEAMPIQQQKDGPCDTGDSEEEVPPSQPSPSEGADGRDQPIPILPATGRRAAGTSWLRLSTDFGA